jgi:hypothetical protein
MPAELNAKATVMGEAKRRIAVDCRHFPPEVEARAGRLEGFEGCSVLPTAGFYILQRAGSFYADYCVSMLSSAMMWFEEPGACAAGRVEAQESRIDDRQSMN